MIQKYLLLIISLVSMIFSCTSETEKNGVEVLVKENIEVQSPEDILPLADSLVIPILYQGTVSLAALPTEEKKQKFIDYMLPIILISRHELMEKHSRVLMIKQYLVDSISISDQDSLLLIELHEQFKTDDIDILLRRTYPHPTSLVLAQAALESGWGTSRFFVQGNNIFGVWSYSENENRMPARFARAEYHAYVRVFDDLKQAIDHYFVMMGRAKAYYKFRSKRLETNNPFELIPYLTAYSEAGAEYVKKLETIIRVNNLTRYDSYQLHPDYFEWQEFEDSSSLKPNWTYSKILPF